MRVFVFMIYNNNGGIFILKYLQLIKPKKYEDDSYKELLNITTREGACTYRYLISSLTKDPPGKNTVSP